MTNEAATWQGLVAIEELEDKAAPATLAITVHINVPRPNSIVWGD